MMTLTDNELLQNNVSINYSAKKLFGTYLTIDGVTEIVVNRPGQVFTECHGEWQQHEAPHITLESCRHFSTELATYNKDLIDDTKPILSSVLPTGERVQIVVPPACERDTISITIRKPSQTFFSLGDYISAGFFDRIIAKTIALSKTDEHLLQLYHAGQYADFLKYAVLYGKNIVIAGETGSGKTTLMKALNEFIPIWQRIVTIEDTPELFMRQHPNYVHLYYPSEAKHGDLITAATLLKACLRMKPDRILLAELRSGETYDFINVMSSGHSGSITSCHAGSVAETWERLILMTLQNEQGRTLSYEVIRRLLQQTIDIVVHVTNSPAGRHITEIYFDPMDKLNIETKSRDN